ncbi:hypothetical protein FACS189487_11210 [Campylobacterota bacterium]|nr:hypothetical protein FACS189487_11210 [Campylobacterota bacterium]
MKRHIWSVNSVIAGRLAVIAGGLPSLRATTRNLAVSILALAISAQAADRFIPPVPDVAIAMEKREILKSCKVPAQVVALPPQVEADYRPCANAYFKPDAPSAAYRLSVMLDREVSVERVETAEGFVRAYEINASIKGGEKLHLICDEGVSRCFTIGADYRQNTTKKDKK